jgi:hypothetical protein
VSHFHPPSRASDAAAHEPDEVRPAQHESEWELDVDFYRAVYADLTHLPDWRVKYHWRRVGHREARFPCADAALAEAFRLGGVDFDAAVYLMLNEDLVAGGIDTEEKAAVHFVLTGHAEGRSFRLEDSGLPFEPPVAHATVDTAPAKRAWPSAQPYHTRPVEWENATSLASRVLGRPMDADGAAIEGWLGPQDPFQRVMSLLTCDEKESPERALASVPPEDFVLFMFLSAFDRAPSAAEFDALVTSLDYGDVRREVLLLQRLAMGVQSWRRPDAGAPSSRGRRERDPGPTPVPLTASDAHDSVTTSDLSFALLGTNTVVSRGDWDRRVREIREDPGSPSRPAARHTAVPSGELPTGPTPLVSVISSIYKPGSFLRPFFEQIVQQTIFPKTELICVLVTPSQAELQLAENYASEHPNLKLVVQDERIGIYEAWNVAVERSSGRFLTNANVDDLRRQDSLEIQARTLLGHEWVDVVYQDVLYTLDSTLSWQEIEEIGFRTKLPPVTPWTLLGMNSPHNAPMWRRDLHDELGLFDSDFESAGDYEFWLRCISRDKVFFKVRDAHVAYYVNPRGLSTRPGGAGLEEALEIGRRYLQLLDYPEPPSYLETIDVAGPRHTRAERMTLGVCSQLSTLRNLQEA